MQRGTIVLTPFPFTNLQSKKVRPALIVSSDYIDNRDIIVAFISSVINEEIINKTDFILRKNEPGFDKTGLKKDSIFKVGKLTTLDKNILLGELGSLPTPLMEKIDKKLKLSLGLI